MKEIFWNNARVEEKRIVWRIQKEYDDSLNLLLKGKITNLQFSKLKALLLCALNLTEKYFTEIYKKEQEMNNE